MCFTQGPQRNGVGEAGTRSPSVSSQALHYWVTVLPHDISMISETNQISDTLVNNR